MHAHHGGACCTRAQALKAPANKDVAAGLKARVQAISKYVPPPAPSSNGNGASGLNGNGLNGNGHAEPAPGSPAALLAECRGLAMAVAVPPAVREQLGKAMSAAGAGGGGASRAGGLGYGATRSGQGHRLKAMQAALSMRVHVCAHRTAPAQLPLPRARRHPGA